MKVLLFDIDGTLILSGGAGLRAMNKAFEQLYGISDILDGITLSGRTDNKIIKDAFDKAQIPISFAAVEHFKQKYFQFIDKEVSAAGTGKRTMPGIDELLPKLAIRENIYMGLLTGNWEISGRAKLDYFDLNKYFLFGAFSDDSSERNELVSCQVDKVG